MSWRPPNVSILIPAFNEEATIARTVEAALAASQRQNAQIIVIDDGSTDRTFQFAQALSVKNSRVMCLTKLNGGKASALNSGLAVCDSNIVVAIDGDTLIEEDAVDLLLAHFADPTIGAVAGTVAVGNPRNWLTTFQEIEYAAMVNLDRRALEIFNAIGVVPGAIGAWRKDAIQKCGGYTADTLAEDADLTLRLERAGWRIVSEPKARAVTEVPETISAFMKQRFRWTFGTLQVAWKHLLQPGEGNGVRRLMIGNVFLFHLLPAFFAPAMDLILLVSILQFALAGESSRTLLILAAYWALFQTIDIGKRDIGISTWRAQGRIGAGALDDLAAFFVSTAPLRCQLSCGDLRRKRAVCRLE